MGTIKNAKTSLLTVLPMAGGTASLCSPSYPRMARGAGKVLHTGVFPHWRYVFHPSKSERVPRNPIIPQNPPITVNISGIRAAPYSNARIIDWVLSNPAMPQQKPKELQETLGVEYASLKTNLTWPLKDVYIETFRTWTESSNSQHQGCLYQYL